MSRKSAKKAKFERCVRAVKAKGTAYNPWAVCHAQLGEPMYENPISKMLAWTLGLGAAAVVGVVGIAALASSKKSSGPTPTRPAPSTPVWTRAAINPTTNSIWLPINSTFAISVPGDDPNASLIVQNLNALITSGVIGSPSSTQVGQAAPAGWPADNLGTNAYRYTGVIQPGSPGSQLQVEGGAGLTADQTTLAWLFAGVSA
jgi:hypothetical protein